MSKALVLMKAMPPTTGHRDLIHFAEALADEVSIVIDTASDEPMIAERLQAVKKMIGPHTGLLHIPDALQDDNDPVFWDLWNIHLARYRGFDYVVASEPYGAKVADIIGARFMPYDPNREINSIKATDVRDNPVLHWDDIVPEFKPYLKTVVTIWGAESTGKTTLSRELAKTFEADWIPEWARPYLETVGPDINIRAMEEIWKGQLALQDNAWKYFSKEIMIQDTDLYSTIGYWEQPHWESELGPVPELLKHDAWLTKSDLYIITQSNIPFEEDPIRYGGDHRESSDEYWIKVAKNYGLNYVVLASESLEDRIEEAQQHIEIVANDNLSRIAYDRAQ